VHALWDAHGVFFGGDDVIHLALLGLYENLHEVLVGETIVFVKAAGEGDVAA
jgi:hypothetical protein